MIIAPADRKRCDLRLSADPRPCCSSGIPSYIRLHAPVAQQAFRAELVDEDGERLRRSTRALCERGACPASAAHIVARDEIDLLTPPRVWSGHAPLAFVGEAGQGG